MKKKISLYIIIIHEKKITLLYSLVQDYLVLVSLKNG